MAAEEIVEELLTPQELAEKWKLDPATIRRRFMDEPGVLIFGEDAPRGKRCYRTIRIPVSVANRVGKRLAR